MAVLVPVYWANYGPTNFLYFCDLALFTTLAAVWTESALLAGMAAVGIVLPQMLWCADFAGHFAGMKLTGMTDYMFDSRRSLFLRGLSLFHGWLPFLLLGLVARLGYDRRALRAWTATAWIAMLVSFFFMPQPGAVLAHPQTPVNINYVFGMSDAAPQSWMPPLAWLGMLMVGMPVLLFWPTHRILKRFFKPPFAENSRDSVRRLREDCAPSLPPCSRASGQPSSPPTFP
ncbi:MAG TPA: hypothetical protein VI454_10065 [Verrucomicrobiae bacterium]